MVNIDEAKQLANYFSDGSPGYILEFSNLEWDLYTKKIVGFGIQEKFGGSKGNSFKEFLVSEDISDHLKFKLIYSLNETMKKIASIRQFVSRAIIKCWFWAIEIVGSFLFIVSFLFLSFHYNFSFDRKVL